MQTRLRWARWGGVMAIGALAVVMLANAPGLVDGGRYVRDMLTFRVTPSAPLRPGGRYQPVYDLVPLTNPERQRYIEAWLRQRGLRVETLPIPGSTQSNLLVRRGPSGPVTLFVAHWDKLYERPAYQGAADNTSGVAVLLAALETLSAAPLSRPVAFLWTGEEEHGLQGAHAFVNWARVEGFEVAEVYSFDMLGRDGVEARPVTDQPGYVFSLPLLGTWVYDGNEVHRTTQPQAIRPDIAARLRAALPSIYIARAMTALGDSNVFEAAGWPDAMLSAGNIYFLDLIWHNDSDRVELLDETSLDDAYRLVLALAKPSLAR